MKLWFYQPSDFIFPAREFFCLSQTWCSSSGHWAQVAKCWLHQERVTSSAPNNFADTQRTNLTLVGKQVFVNWITMVSILKHKESCPRHAAHGWHRLERRYILIACGMSFAFRLQQANQAKAAHTKFQTKERVISNISTLTSMVIQSLHSRDCRTIQQRVDQCDYRTSACLKQT